MGQSNAGQLLPNEYCLVREFPNGSIVRQQNSGVLHFLKEYSFTNQEAYQQAFVNFSKKLPEKHQHILYLQRTNTKLDNTFCSTFYKISLLYEYLEHTLQHQIEERLQHNKVFDEKEVWSVLCSCVLGVSEMIRVEGRSHSALSTKDIRLNEEGLVKILSLQMIGMEPEHDLNQQGTTRQLATTILQCLLMESVTNDSEEYLHELIQNLDSTAEMKNILRMMLSSQTKFIELEQYLFRMVQEDTDSFNSYSNTPSLKEKHPQKPQNSYSKIAQESKEDDSLPSMTKDLQENSEILLEWPENQEQETPDQHNSMEQTNTRVSESQQNTLRDNSNTASLQESRKSSKVQESRSSNWESSEQQENSLFTDPKLLNLIHTDLQELKKRKSVAGSRKIGIAESKYTQEIKQEEPKVLQMQSINMHLNALAESKELEKSHLSRQAENRSIRLEQRTVNSLPAISNNLVLPLFDAVQHHSSSIQNEQVGEAYIQQNSQSSNPERKDQKRYDNIMDNEDMGFKKKKNKDSRATVTLSNSNAANTVIYNSNQSNQQQKVPISSYLNQSHRESLPRSKEHLEYVTETYVRGRYEGTKLKNMRHGKGTFFYNQGGKYIGQWKQNKMYGKGILYYPNNEIAYDGQWKNDQLEGRGTLYNEDVIILSLPFDFKNWEKVQDYWVKYEGEFAQDSKNGQGKLYLSSGQIFEGHFRDDMVWGQGQLYRKDGTCIHGLWKENKLVRIY